MVKIRQGMMKDCTDLLEVYQGTRWFYRIREGGYTTVEHVKDEHRGAAFERWGWLVAEEKGRVIGEIVFRIEKNPISGKIGIIRNLDVDVRNQKTTVGTQLTQAAEKVMKSKNVARVIATTPPASYNYWMKVKYFARGSIAKLKSPLGKIPTRKTTKIKTNQLKDLRKLPASLKFSHIAYPGAFAELAADIIDGRFVGKIFEFQQDDKLIGIGAITKKDSKSAVFVADITKRGIGSSDIVISRTALSASSWKVKSVETMIPKDQLEVYSTLSKWSSELSTDIPVTRLI
ncbi:MAG: GNAT family N-acetyltransferase [Candidatus Thorarchaeota archaeon]|nr:GNAT family N-acetyltransferase [Candidatus Thorarchaeota archaeon]